jgi:HrpA-like RNA helicase
VPQALKEFYLRAAIPCLSTTRRLGLAVHRVPRIAALARMLRESAAQEACRTSLSLVAVLPQLAFFLRQSHRSRYKRGSDSEDSHKS